MISGVNLLLFIACLVWMIFLLFFRYFEIWIFYFITGVAGFVLLGVQFLKESYFEVLLSSTSVIICDLLAGVLKLDIQTFSQAGVIFLSSNNFDGFISLAIGLECSGLLELIVLWSMLCFFPIFKRSERIWYLLWGSIAIFSMNLFRILIVLLAIQYFGRDSIFIVHGLLARGILFLFMVMLFWEIFTRKSIKQVQIFSR